MSQRTRDRVFHAAVGALLIATSLLSGCGGGSDSSSATGPGPVSPPTSTAPPAVLQAKEAGTPVDPTIVTADNTFGLNLLNTIIADNAGQNTAISPISVAMTLQILYNGAVGPTQSTLAQTLQLGDLSVSQLNSDNAGCTGIFPGFYVNVAQHKTYVQVDESGTVAAAATGVGATSIASFPVNLQINHPFFYTIRDNRTGELLFVGVLMNPSAG